MSIITYAEQEIAALSGDDSWERCGNEVKSLNALIEWLLNHPRPCPMLELGRVAEGMHQVGLGVYYKEKELTKSGLSEIKSATATIRATCGEWKMADDNQCGTGKNPFAWALAVLQWIHDHPKGPIVFHPVPPRPIGPWFRQLSEVLVGVQETITLGGIRDPTVRQAAGRAVFERINLAVKNMEALKM